MLELVLDKEFINTFHLAYNGNEEYVDDFRKYFIKNMQKLKLVSNYIDIEDIKSQAKDNPLLELIIERIPTLDFRSDLLTQIDSQDFPVTGSPFKLVLTGENTETCNKRRKRFGLEYLNPSNLSDRWKLYFSQRTDISRKTTLDAEIPDEYKFDSWDKFKSFSHPLNSVIIIDFYFLAWKTKNELDINMRNNILPLLEKLMVEASDEVPVEILILSEINDKSPTPTQNNRVIESQQKIEVGLKLLTKKKFSLNIIVHNKMNYPRDFEAFHDRAVITNFFYIESGKGFNLFRGTGRDNRVDGNTEVKFRFIFNPQNFYTVFKDLKNLGIYCEKIENNPGRPDYLNYCPQKTNRLLNIERN